MKSLKVTESARKRYDDACAAAHAMDILGERWALLVVRELMFGPRRFSDLRRALPGISANILTQRLEGLEAHGVVERRRLPPPASVQVYDVTPWGREAEEVLQALGRWAARSPLHDPTRPISASSVLLSFRTMLHANTVRGRFGFRIDGEEFLGTLDGGNLTVERGNAGLGDVVFTGQAAALAAAVYGGVPFDALAKQGALQVEGDRDLAERFVRLFPLPEKVAAA